MNTTVPPLNPTRVRMRQLQLVVQLLQEGSLLRAAEALGMSQSAASRLLADLEREAGAVLFTRHARGIEVTPAGEVLARRAGIVMTELARARDELLRLRKGEQSNVAMGTLLGPCNEFIPAALLRLARESASTSVSVHVDTSRALVKGLMDGRFDLVVARVGDPSLEPELQFEPLVEEHFCVVARPGHPLAGRRRIALADLSAQRWVLPPVGSDLRQRLDTLWLQHGLPPLASAVESVSAPLVLSLLRMSDAVAALPREFVRPYARARSLAVLRIELGVRSERFGIVTHRHRGTAPALRRVLQALREQAALTYRQD